MAHIPVYLMQYSRCPRNGLSIWRFHLQRAVLNAQVKYNFYSYFNQLHQLRLGSQSSITSTATLSASTVFDKTGVECQSLELELVMVWNTMIFCPARTLLLILLVLKQPRCSYCALVPTARQA